MRKDKHILIQESLQFSQLCMIENVRISPCEGFSHTVCRIVVGYKDHPLNSLSSTLVLNCLLFQAIQPLPPVSCVVPVHELLRSKMTHSITEIQHLNWTLCPNMLMCVYPLDAA